MYVDTLVVGAVVSELQHLIGGRIQQIVMPTPDSVGLEVYQGGVRHQLLLSAHSNYARLHLVPTKLTRGPGADMPLLLLLRKFVRGGRITRFECPALERVVTISITKMPTPRNQAPDDEPDDDEVLIEPHHSELIIEIIGKSSNIVLVNDSSIVVESVRHFTPGRSQRPIMPRGIYELPPRQDKHDPRRATGVEIAGLSGDTLAKALVARYRGVSPQTAREVAARVLGTADAPIAARDAEAVAETLRLLTGGQEQRPSLARDADGQPIAVAPFWLQQHANVEEQPDVNTALAVAFANVDRATAHAQTRDALAERVEEMYRRARTKADQLRTQLARADQLERLRWEGEMIFGYLHTLQQGQVELFLDNAVITLDPTLTGVENAQARFREYDKAKGALEDVPRLLEQAEAQANYLRETTDLLRLAESYEEIEQFERELGDQGLLKQSNTKHKSRGKSTVRRGPLRVLSPDGWTIYIGRSAAQNDEVTFKIAQPNDYWLHVRGRTGGHVIVRMQADELPPATLERAAQLAAYYSSARYDGVADVDLARRKHVRRIKDGPPGLVRYEAERTVRVAPHNSEAKA